MSRPAEPLKCRWDGSISGGECDAPATRHVSWKLREDNGGGTRHRHFCDAHAAEMRAHRGDVHDEPMSRCGVRCYQ